MLKGYHLKQQKQNQTLIRQLSDHSSEKAAQRLWELKEKEAVLESALARSIRCNDSVCTRGACLKISAVVIFGRAFSVTSEFSESFARRRNYN